MAGTGVTVDTAAFRRSIPEETRERRREAISRVGKKASRLAELAKVLAPRLKQADPRFYPGELADSIAIERLGETSWEVQVWARWAAYVEFGTAEHGHAQPYLRPAAATVAVESV
jgi:hypothetical protein